MQSIKTPHGEASIVVQCCHPIGEYYFEFQGLHLASSSLLMCSASWPIWGTRMEFLIPGFSLAHTWPWQHFGK